jgi:ribosomal subunit interface protein
MQLEVTFRRLNPRDEIRKRAEVLFAKFDRFLDPAAEGQLVVTVEHQQAICELVVKSRGQVFKAETADEQLRASIDLVFHNMEEQLRRFKDKRTDRRGRGPGEGDGLLPPSEGEPIDDVDLDNEDDEVVQTA